MSSANAETERDWLDIDIFAHVPDPGFPEDITVAQDGTVYVGTSQHGSGIPNPPSRIFAFNREGELQQEFVIEGQDRTKASGILGMELDGDGIIYALDRHPSRVIAVDPKTAEQWDYARFRDVHTCVPLFNEEDCSSSLLDQGPIADDLTFAPDGTMYVTDLTQGLIWRVPPGGGDAEVWFTDSRVDSALGPNGIEFMADGETLMFAQTFASAFDGTPPRPDVGRLYTLPVRPDGSPGQLELFWQGQPGEGIDNFKIAASGNIYAALPLANSLAVISPDGEELARTPSNHIENLQMAVPMDSPAGVDFIGRRVLVANHAFLTGNPHSFVVYDIYAGETGLGEFRPKIR